MHVCDLHVAQIIQGANSEVFQIRQRSWKTLYNGVDPIAVYTIPI